LRWTEIVEAYPIALRLDWTVQLQVEPAQQSSAYSHSLKMDNRRVQELFEEEDRDDDSIPLADDDPADVLEESNMTEDKRKEYEWRRKADFESLDSIPSMLSDKSDIGYQQSASSISDHMTRKQP